MDQHGQRRRMLGRPLSRRRLLQGSLAAGGALTVSGFGAARGPWFIRGAQEGGFTGEASITAWGMNVQETDQLVFARVEAFKQAFPNIQVEFVPEAADERIVTANASDSLPDIIVKDRFSTASWASRGVWRPLTDLIERDGFDTSRFVESAITEATYDGQLYGIPSSMDVQMLFVNADALREIEVDPATVDTGNWDQLLDLGSKLVQRSGDVVERWGFDHKIQDGFFYLWAGANGADLINDDGTEVSLDDPKAVEALDWGVRVAEAQGGFASYEAVKGTWSGDEQFARGQVAMTVYQSWMLTGVMTRVPPAFEFQVMPVKPRGGDGIYSVAGGNAFFIPEGAENPDAAWEFIKFMVQDDTWLIGANARKQQRQAEGTAYVPSLTGSKTADQAQVEHVYEPIAGPFDEAVRQLPDILANSQPREVYVSPAGALIDTRLDQSGVEPALRGDLSAEEALQQADEDAQNELDLL